MLPPQVVLNADIDAKEGAVGAGWEDGLTQSEQCWHRVSGEGGSWCMSLSLVPGLRMGMALLCLRGLHLAGDAQGESVPRH